LRRSMDEQLSLNFDLPPLPGASPALAPTAPQPSAAERRKPAAPPPFSYSAAMEEVVRDVVTTLPELRHVDLDRVLVSIMQARQKSQHGVYASCCPLRFENGESEVIHGGRRFRMPPLQHDGREVLYLLYFMLPRFHEEQDYHGKLATVIHELYHISPHFNGDIRRFPGKNFAHGHSREQYHRAMCHLATRYLATSPRANDWEFLRMPFSELLKRPGGVVGRAVPKPRAVLVPSESRRGRS
jgi:predicted metallopeptidase